MTSKVAAGWDRKHNTALLPNPGETPDVGGHSLISGHPTKWPAGDDLGEFIVRTDTGPRGALREM